MEENLPVSLRRVCLLLPFDQAGLVAQIRKDHVLYQEEYRPDGILFPLCWIRFFMVGCANMKF